MLPENYQEHVLTLRRQIADLIDQFALDNPNTPVDCILVALGEALVNIGVQQAGFDYTQQLCIELKHAVEAART